jgi:predicted alpha/beta-hydrolase family hydrolase
MDMLFDGPCDANLTLVLAHGAGAAMDSPFMDYFAAALAARGNRVVRFEFPYMQRRRAEGGRRPPDRQPRLLGHWRAVIEHVGAPRLAIGGKSMGGRMASLLADEVGATALVCLGYPFHPSGKPEKLRTEHLLELSTPALFVQGTRDPLGSAAEVAGYGLPPGLAFHWCPDGNHDLTPRKKSGLTKEQNWDGAIAAIASFLNSLD